MCTWGSLYDNDGFHDDFFLGFWLGVHRTGSLEIPHLRSIIDTWAFPFWYKSNLNFQIFQICALSYLRDICGSISQEEMVSFSFLTSVAYMIILIPKLINHVGDEQKLF